MTNHKLSNSENQEAKLGRLFDRIEPPPLEDQWRGKQDSANKVQRTRFGDE
jgi:hypothetical protein